MITKKILALSVISIIIITTFSTVSFAYSSEYGTLDLKNSNDDESHVIEGVPYSPQKRGIYCEYASVEMVLQYYDINTSEIEIIYNVGGGCSIGYKPSLMSKILRPIIRPPYKFRFWTDEVCGGTFDYKFMANLYGLSFDYIYPKSIVNHEKQWNEYWENLKNYIRNDIPVITGIDPLVWPPYMEIQNITFIIPALFAGSHVIVVVGYNESNQTVCVNDPAGIYYSCPEKGYYLWVNLSDFKRAVQRINYELNYYKYTMLIFKEISDPLPKEIAADLAHQRNIQKMKGIKSAYDEDFMNKNFYEFGINALKALREDFKSKFLVRIPAFKIIAKLYPLSYPFVDVLRMMERNFAFESVTKQDVSEYLMENKELCEYYEKDAILLKTESKYWKNLSILMENLEVIILNKTLVKAILLSKPILNEIVKTLDSIIAIENMIIYE